MKLYVKFVPLMLSLILWAGSSSLSAATFEGAQDSLLIKGSVFHKKNKIRTVKVNLYVDNQNFETVEVESSNKFYTNLPLNKIVTVEITVPGYHKKRLLIDTHVPEKHSRRLVYDFDMDIYSEEEMEGVNTSILDFPVGLVQYQKGKFVRNPKYTDQMKQEYVRLLEDAYVAEGNHE